MSKETEDAFKEKEKAELQWSARDGLVINVKHQLAKLAGMRGFYPEDVKEDRRAMSEVLETDMVDAIMPSTDQEAYNRRLLEKIKGKFSGLDEAEVLAEGVKGALRVCDKAVKNPKNKRALSDSAYARDGVMGWQDIWVRKLTHIKQTLENLEDAASVWEAARPIIQKLEKRQDLTKEESLIYAQAKGYKDLVGSMLENAKEELSNPSEKLSPKSIKEQLGARPVEDVLAHLKKSQWEVRNPIIASISKKVRKFFPPRSSAGRKPPSLKRNNTKIER